jgi:hypothetical protein
VEDHHVDRPDVEAQQCVKLTGTNSSFGLIVLINQCPQRKALLLSCVAHALWTPQGRPKRWPGSSLPLLREPKRHTVCKTSDQNQITSCAWEEMIQHNQISPQLFFADLVAIA